MWTRLQRLPRIIPMCDVYGTDSGRCKCMADKLPSYAPVEDQTVQIAQIQSMLGDSVNWIDAQGVLNANKDKKIYYHTDSRWTTLGASLVWQQIASDLGLDTSKAPALKPYVVTGDFSGNLSRTSGFESG